MDIEDLRARIDRIDAQILQLLNRRVRAAQQIGKLKQTDGATVYAPQREAQIFRRLLAANDGPMPDDGVRAVYTEIISACRASEKKMRIALPKRGCASPSSVLRARSVTRR
jgi:chorismate mutase/prephenate dehydratase